MGEMTERNVDRDFGFGIMVCRCERWADGCRELGDVFHAALYVGCDWGGGLEVGGGDRE